MAKSKKPQRTKKPRETNDSSSESSTGTETSESSEPEQTTGKKHTRNRREGQTTTRKGKPEKIKNKAGDSKRQSQQKQKQQEREAENEGDDDDKDESNYSSNEDSENESSDTDSRSNRHRSNKKKQKKKQQEEEEKRNLPPLPINGNTYFVLMVIAQFLTVAWLFWAYWSTNGSVYVFMIALNCVVIAMELMGYRTVIYEKYKDVTTLWNDKKQPAERKMNSIISVTTTNTGLMFVMFLVQATSVITLFFSIPSLVLETDVWSHVNSMPQTSKAIFALLIACAMFINWCDWSLTYALLFAVSRGCVLLEANNYNQLIGDSYKFNLLKQQREKKKEGDNAPPISSQQQGALSSQQQQQQGAQPLGFLPHHQQQPMFPFQPQQQPQMHNPLYAIPQQQQPMQPMQRT